ncbi:MAG: hypothetical protein ACR2KP_07775, partial [Egibacteraceae bacterium]
MMIDWSPRDETVPKSMKGATVGAVLNIRMIGAPQIECANGDLAEVRGRKSWALLARVLLSERALTRRELSAELFP